MLSSFLLLHVVFPYQEAAEAAILQTSAIP